MHMVSKRDLDTEVETVRISRSPTTVMTANDEVQDKRRSDSFVKQLCFFFLKVMFLKKFPQFLPWKSSVRIKGFHVM